MTPFASCAEVALKLLQPIPAAASSSYREDDSNTGLSSLSRAVVEPVDEVARVLQSRDRRFGTASSASWGGNSREYRKPLVAAAMNQWN